MNRSILRISWSLVLVTALLGVGSQAHAFTYAESGDAGSLPTSAQAVSDTAMDGTPLQFISGNVESGFVPYEFTDSIDLFEIELTGGAFSASTVGGANFHTQLYLYDAQGNGIIFNDDADSTVKQSTLSASNLAAGLYYLGVSVSAPPVLPVDASRTLIFPQPPAPAEFHPGIIEANPDAGPLAGYAPQLVAQQPLVELPYTIALSGVQATPEPIAGGGAVSMAILMLVARFGGQRRREMATRSRVRQ